MAQSTTDEPEVILLRADPEVIPADGQSSATITAEVRTRRGGLVADGTQVRFTSTVGAVTQMVVTRAGIARATLRSTATEETAEVTATAGVRALARTRVTFTAEKLPGQQMKPFVRVEAQSIQYIPEKGLVDAAGEVRLTYRGFVVTASLLQLDIGSLRVKARSKVRLRSGTHELTADLLFLDMQQAEGSLVALEDSGIRRQRFAGYGLQILEAQEAPPASTYDFEEIEDPKAVMTARKLTLFPGEKLQMSGFALYVAGARVVGLPFYVISLNPYGQDADQYLTIDSVGGLSVNLPFYYSVTDSSNGSIRLRRQSRYGYSGYDTRPGWQLAAEQRYSFGQSNHGVLELSDITSRDWGVRWRHDHQFGRRTHTYFSVDSPARRDVYARTELYHSFGLGDLSISSYGSFLPNLPASMQSRAYFRLRPGTIKGLNIQYYWSANLGWSQWAGRSYLEKGVDLQVHPPSIPLGRMTSLQFYAGTGYTISDSGTGPNAQASVGLSRRLGRRARTSLRYSYYYSGRTSEFFGPSASQSLTGQLFAEGSTRWQASLTTTYVPGTRDVSAYGTLAYMPWRNWRIELRPTYSRFGRTGWSTYPGAMTYLDVYLARQLGGRDVGLRWSTFDNKIRFELGTTALRF